jgi:phage terminase small subunit
MTTEDHRSPRHGPTGDRTSRSPLRHGDSGSTTGRKGTKYGLSVREARFVDLYLLTFNAGRAYIEAGYTAKSAATARACASRLLTNANVRTYLAQRTEAMFQNLAEQQSALMRALTFTAYADPRELVEHVRGACRYCWGKFNRWQYTAGEWDGKMAEYVEKQERAAEKELSAPAEPDPKGGTGYNLNADPNADCPECGGDGLGRTVVKDTRHLSPAALALYAGVKEGRDGVEVKMADQMQAREMLAKIVKVYEDSMQVTVQFHADELTERYGRIMAEAQERMRLMREERRRLRQDREASGQ